MKRHISKINTLENLFLENKILTREQIMEALKVNYSDCRKCVGILRKGTKLRKDGTFKRPPYNIQSVSKKGNQLDRHYELISKNTGEDKLKEVLIRTQKEVTTKGKFTFNPTSKTFIKKVHITVAKKFLLEMQGVIIDSYLIEEKT